MARNRPRRREGDLSAAGGGRVPRIITLTDPREPESHFLRLYESTQIKSEAAGAVMAARDAGPIVAITFIQTLPMTRCEK